MGAPVSDSATLSELTTRVDLLEKQFVSLEARSLRIERLVMLLQADAQAGRKVLEGKMDLLLERMQTRATL